MDTGPQFEHAVIKPGYEGVDLFDTTTVAQSREFSRQQARGEQRGTKLRTRRLHQLGEPRRDFAK
jgi:hypothetical protein